MEQDKKLAKLEQSLSKALIAEQFTKSDTGRLFTELAELEINKALKDITSDKYDKDHQGFLARKADMNAYKTLLRRMQLLASPQMRAKLEEQLEDAA